jgi:hypothetical protein
MDAEMNMFIDVMQAFSNLPFNSSSRSDSSRAARPRWTRVSDRSSALSASS